MTMRKRRKNPAGSLDSLLDTMTNVVGILVILLVVTQLGVRDAVRRIAASDSVRPETLEKARSDLQQAMQRRADLIVQVRSLRTGDSAAELRRVRRELADVRADVTVLEQTRSERLAGQQAQLAEAQRRIEQQLRQQREQIDRLLRRIKDDLAKLAQLEARLEERPRDPAIPAKVVHLPNPRPAPEAAEPITFICREGRIATVALESFLDRARKRADYAVRSKRLDRNPEAGIDCAEIVKAFEREKIRDVNFDAQFAYRGRYPFLVFARRPAWGESTEQIERQQSRYQQFIKRIQPQRHYLRFLVWPDSFETYLAARQIATDRGLLAGWTPQTIAGEYEVRLGGTLRCGPPPKPQPKPPAPNPPKPAPPKPAPPPRPLPSDVID